MQPQLDNENETLALIIATNETAAEIVTVVQETRRALYDAWALLAQGEGSLADLSAVLNLVDMQVEMMQKQIARDAVAEQVMGETLNKMQEDYSALVHEVAAWEITFEHRVAKEADERANEQFSERIDQAFSRDAFLEDQRAEWLADRIVEEGWETVQQDERTATENRLNDARDRAEWEMGYGPSPADATDEDYTEDEEN